MALEAHGLEGGVPGLERVEMELMRGVGPSSMKVGAGLRDAMGEARRAPPGGGLGQYTPGPVILAETSPVPPGTEAETLLQDPVSHLEGT